MDNSSTVLNSSGASESADSGGDFAIALQITFGVTVTLWIILGNILVIVTYRTYVPLQTVANFFIVNLAIADGITGFASLLIVFIIRLMPLTMYCTFKYQSIGLLLSTVPFSASLLFLLMISIDRFIAIFWSLRYEAIMTHKRAIMTSCVVWIFSVIYFLIILMDNYFLYESNLEQAILVCVSNTGLPRFMGMTYPLFYIIVLIPHIVIYSCIFMMARAQQNKVQTTNGVASSNSNLKLVKTALIVIGLFVVCWTPFIFYVTLIQLDLIDSNEPTVNTGLFTAYLLATINSGMNPIVYAVRLTNFRTAMRKLLKLKPNNVENSD